MFLDKITLAVRAGKGGNGVVSWRREKYIPKGGPAGGNGGGGGSVFLSVDPGELSLERYRHTRIVVGDNGGSGGGNNRQGKTGKDIEIKLPSGTLVKNADTGEILWDAIHAGEKFQLCRGGKGGKGNSHFKSPTHQAPVICTPGTEGEAINIELELKLIADVGFVGMPNAGKSTLMKALTKIPVKIAPYPFTTLDPNLGMVEFDDYSRIMIADIPGIIEDASQNRGLGISFLKHIERTSVLIFVIDASGLEGRDPIDDFLVLQNELALYDPEMLQRPHLVALNKIDMEESPINAQKFQEKFPDKTIFTISAAEKLGTTALLEKARALVQKNGKKFH